jgi:hypothetical protein
MTDHFCMALISSRDRGIFIGRPGDPGGCGRIAQFEVSLANYKNIWLCAEHYDMWVRWLGHEVYDDD